MSVKVGIRPLLIEADGARGNCLSAPIVVEFATPIEFGADICPTLTADRAAEAGDSDPRVRYPAAKPTTRQTAALTYTVIRDASLAGDAAL